MTDRNIIVRDLIVHRHMDRFDLPNDQELAVRHSYGRFRQLNEPAFDYLEELAVNLGDPKFKAHLDQIANSFSEWHGGPRS